MITTMPEALDWLRETWEARDTPSRLHSRDHEGWGLAYAPAFARRLGAKPDDTATVIATRTCNHLRIPKNADAWTCPDCRGAGTYEQESLVYCAPMWRAMTRLREANALAHDIVLSLVINAYDVADTCEVTGCSEDSLVAAVRQLHSHYQRAPQLHSIGWVSKSESQRAAESAA